FAQEKEPPEREFGDQGVIAIGAATSLDVSYTATSAPGGAPGSHTVNLGIEPEVQYFVINGLSVGGIVAFDWAKESGTNTTTTAIGLGPTVGYNVWLTPGPL